MCNMIENYIEQYASTHYEAYRINIVFPDVYNLNWRGVWTNII